MAVEMRHSGFRRVVSLILLGVLQLRKADVDEASREGHAAARYTRSGRAVTMLACVTLLATALGLVVGGVSNASSGSFVAAATGTLVLEARVAPGGTYDKAFTFSGDVTATLGGGSALIALGNGLYFGSQKTVASLVPGRYSTTEADPLPTFELSDITCDDPTHNSSADKVSRTATFDISAGEIVRCTFTNTDRRTGTLVLEARVAPGGSYDTTFHFSGDVSADLMQTHFGTPRLLSGYLDTGAWELTRTALVPGRYSTTEADPLPTFELSDITCDD